MPNIKINKHCVVITFLLSVFLFIISCKSETKHPQVSFYYWRTIFTLNKTEKQTLKNNNVNNLYIRYFDIDVDKKGIPFPESPVIFKDKPLDVNIIPVFYIKNKVMLQSGINLDSLALRAFSLITQINEKNNLQCSEIQLDCDWSLESKNNFMKFVDVFKKVSKKKLSATIRLHQIKYFAQTSVPNVDKAVLMYYNMGKIAPDSLNSIYDRNIAKKYIGSMQKYPMKLDIALPVFSWGIHIRDNNVIKLLSKINEKTFETDPNFEIDNKTNNIFVKKSNIKYGNYFLQGDIVKIEKISKHQLQEMLKDIKKHLDYIPSQIIFYDLDSINLINYNNDEHHFFKKITNRY